MIKKALYVMLLLVFSCSNVHAFWWGNNNNVYNGWGNNWPVWTPMYWMDEFAGNNNVNHYWGDSLVNNSSFSTNPWHHNFNNGWASQQQTYFPYVDVGGASDTGYPVTYFNAYRPLSGFQNMPLLPSKGSVAFNP